MAEIKFDLATITVPQGDLNVRRLSRTLRQNVFPTTSSGSGKKRTFTEGNHWYEGAFVAIAQQGWDLDEIKSGVLALTLPAVTAAVQYDIIMTQVQDTGDWDSGGLLIVQGAWVGTKK